MSPPYRITGAVHRSEGEFNGKEYRSVVQVLQARGSEALSEGLKVRQREMRDNEEEFRKYVRLSLKL